MAENKEELSIEEMFDRLDGIMRTLEDSRSTLEESFASYEAGMRLVRACSEKIDKVEKQIVIIDDNGVVDLVGGGLAGMVVV